MGRGCSVRREVQLTKRETGSALASTVQIDRKVWVRTELRGN